MEKRRSPARIAIVVLVILAAVALYFLFRDPAGERQTEFLGNVDVREVELGFELQGRIASMNFDEGDRVRKGQLMATLDTALLQDRIRSATAGMEAARAEMSRVKNGNRPEEIAIARSDVQRRQSALTEAAREYDRRRQLVESGAVSRADFEASRRRFDQARADLEAGRQNLKLLRSGSRQEDVRLSEAAASSAQAELAEARTRMGKSELIAPSDGVVTSRIEEPGAIAGAGAPVYRLTIDRPVHVRAYAAETALTYLKPGTQVSVHADGTDKSWSGKIGYVSPKAEFTPKTVQTQDMRTDLVYRFRVVVDNPDGGLRQGQPVTVRLEPGKAAEKSGS